MDGLEIYLINRFNKTIMEWLECKLHEGKNYFVYYYILQCLASCRSSMKYCWLNKYNGWKKGGAESFPGFWIKELDGQMYHLVRLEKGRFQRNQDFREIKHVKFEILKTIQVQILRVWLVTMFLLWFLPSW